jgi:nucleotide-binding universal stress UspA family protein
MYSHILVPIDSTELSKKAVQTAAGMATQFGSKITLFHAAPSEVWHMYAESVAYSGQYLETFRDEMKRNAERLLTDAAKTTSVKVATDYVHDDNPADAIVNAAKRLNCDLIIMASHGHKGIKGLLLGSETHKVLTHTDLPVLVVR